MISAVENTILKAVDTRLPNVLNGLGSLPGELTDAMIKRAIKYAPAVYIAFTGGADKQLGRQAAIDAKFSLYAITQGGIEPNRRRNNAISAYAIIEAVMPVVHNLLVPTVGTVQAKGIRNLFSDTFLDIDCTVYAMDLSIDLSFDANAVIADEFLTFYADYDIEPFTKARYPVWLGGDRATAVAPDAQDTKTLTGTL